MKKITRTTIKSFINKNRDNLFIEVKDRFDGMVDCVMPTDSNGFKQAEPTDRALECTLGVNGVWLVGNSRDYFETYEQNGYKGYNVYNCCGSFNIAVKA